MNRTIPFFVRQNPYDSVFRTPEFVRFCFSYGFASESRTKKDETTWMVSSEMLALGFGLSGEKHEPLSDSELLEAAYYEKAEARRLAAT